MKCLPEAPPAPLSEPADPQDWLAFVKANCNALFQTALLLAADPEVAEASIAATLAGIDSTRPPQETSFAALQEALARQSIERARLAASSKISQARSMLHSGLQPVLQIERNPRICFVLRMLLGYATSSCARIMGIEEPSVRTLLSLAILQLQNVVAGKDARLMNEEASGPHADPYPSHPVPARDPEIAAISNGSRNG